MFSKYSLPVYHYFDTKVSLESASVHTVQEGLTEDHTTSFSRDGWQDFGTKDGISFPWWKSCISWYERVHESTTTPANSSLVNGWLCTGVFTG
jgi:hypothetical protein